MTFRSFLLQLAAVYVCALPVYAQTQAGMVPFSMNPRAGANLNSPVDVSFLLDAPAGKHGPVIVKDGHLATRDDGRRIRFWGVNITDWSKGSRQIPSKEDAPYIAGTLARFGINAVRFQFLDLQVPRGLVAEGDNTRSLDADAVDREDFFIAELEKRGIYIDFNLLVGRPFKAGDGVNDASSLREGAKGTSLYDTRMLELQKQYAKELLDHENPYTHRAYTADPAVAIVEINNEDAINVGFHPPSAFYGEELTGLYNQWLQKQRTPREIDSLRQLTGTAAGASIPLIRPGGASTAPTERFHTEAEFFNDLQRGYFDDFQRYLKQTLHSHSLVIATADHNHSGSGYPVLRAEQGMDIIDGHTYWQHPEHTVHKLPMVNDPANSTVVELSRSAIAGKPYTVSEVNNPFPNDYAGEGIPILAAYGALQDWDGIFWYTFEPKPDPAWKPYIGDPFDISLDPVKMPEMAASALMFLRNDVEKARTISARSYTRDQVSDSMLLPPFDRPYFTAGFPLDLPLKDEVRIASFNGPPMPPILPTIAPHPIVSDTGQLHWYTSSAQDGVVTVDTPRSQAMIGFVSAHHFTVTNFTAAVENRFCTILVSSMDGRPIESSAELLLIAGGVVRNTGQTWNSVGTDVTSFGGPPTLIENVKGTIELRDLQGASAVGVQAIDGAGQPLAKMAQATREGANWRINLGNLASTWYIITVSR